MVEFLSNFDFCHLNLQFCCGRANSIFIDFLIWARRSIVNLIAPGSLMKSMLWGGQWGPIWGGQRAQKGGGAKGPIRVGGPKGPLGGGAKGPLGKFC